MKCSREADDVVTKRTKATSERTEVGVSSKRREKVKAGAYNERLEPEKTTGEAKAQPLFNSKQT